ncbi:MAG: single-stranded DNA-binding protein [Corynebacterium sp.]|nr:single-stranded DNA-binding protein [Corynebacterium sp.]
MSQYTVTITGNLAADPTLTRFKGDKYSARLRVASSRRTREQKDNGQWDWRDNDTMYMDVEVWGQLAINASKSLKRGMPVICHGSLCTDQWVDNETQKNRERTYLRALQLGIDMNRYIVASQRMDATHTPEGMVIPNIGTEHLHVDRDFTTYSDDDVRDEVPTIAAVPELKEERELVGA